MRYNISATLLLRPVVALSGDCSFSQLSALYDFEMPNAPILAPPKRLVPSSSLNNHSARAAFREAAGVLTCGYDDACSRPSTQTTWRDVLGWQSRHFSQYRQTRLQQNHWYMQSWNCLLQFLAKQWARKISADKPSRQCPSWVLGPVSRKHCRSVCQ